MATPLNPQHTMTVGYESEGFTAQLHCHATPETSWCRTEPDRDCQCESYSEPQQDEHGWFHDAYDGETDSDVRHRHVPSKYCRKVESVEDADGPVWRGPTGPVYIATVPVDFEWDEGFTWYPAFSVRP